MQSHVLQWNLHIPHGLLLIIHTNVGTRLTGLYVKASSPSWEWQKLRERLRKWEGEKERKEERERVRYTVTHSSHTASSSDYSSKGPGNWNTFAHWHISLWPFLRADTQKENPLTLAGLLQILAGLSCKAGRHTETAGFNTVPLVCTLSSGSRANALLLDILGWQYIRYQHKLFLNLRL